LATRVRRERLRTDEIGDLGWLHSEPMDTAMTSAEKLGSTPAEQRHTALVGMKRNESMQADSQSVADLQGAPKQSSS